MADKRQLQAIMFTDIHGYSARMGEDEQNTVRVVREHRVIVRDALAANSGREVRTIGDAFFVLFDSATDAVRCAVSIQQALAERNRGLAAKDQVVVRVGINAGDVLIGAEGELYGEAVNIAARVEPIAPPGGVCVTESVYAQVHRLIDEPFEPLGVVPLKNIERPPALYVLRLGSTAKAKVPARAWPRWPLGVVAVAAVVGLAFLAGRHGATGSAASEEPVASQIPEAEAAYEDAIAALARGDDGAVRFARAATERDPDSARAWLLLNVVAEGPGEGQLALERAVALTRDGTDGTAALIHLVDAANRELGHGVAPDHASPLGPEWDAWLAANPHDSFGAFVRATHYPPHGNETNFHADDPHREHYNVRELRTFVATHPRWPSGRIALARSLGPDHSDEAIAVLREGLAGCNECTALRVILADMLFAREDFVGARAELIPAIAADPTLATDARMRLADIALFLNDAPERERLVATILAPETPLPQRAVFGSVHGSFLLVTGHARAATDLLTQTLDALLAEGRADDAVQPLIMLAHGLASLGEPERVSALSPVFERVLAMPELGPTTRNVLAMEQVTSQGEVAFANGDAATLRELAERVHRLPPERTQGVDPVVITRALERQATAIEHGSLDETGDVLDSCGANFDRARLFARAGDARLTPTLQRLAGTDVCHLEHDIRVAANVQLAELSLADGDPASARGYAKSARALWPDPDPDLRWAQRLAAVEAALPPAP